MIPLIDKKKTGVHLRRIMDSRGITVKDVQQYLNLGSVQSILSLVKWSEYAYNR